MSDQPSVLIVDDDEGIRRTLEMILTKKTYQAVTAPDGKTALALAQERDFNLALLDVRLPDMAGTDVLAELKARRPDLEVLIITGHATLETAIQSLSRGAYHYFIKPLNVDELLITLEKALQKQHLTIENRNLLASVQSELGERVIAEVALRESEEKYRILVERANDGIAIVQDGVVKYINPRQAELWGGTADEIVGTPFADYVHPSEMATVAERYQQRMAGEQIPTLYETVLRRRDGSKVYAELNAGLVTFQGKPADLVIIRDITERKRAEEEIAAERNLLRTLINNLPDRIYIKDTEGRFLLNNQAHLRALGAQSQEQMLGKTDLDFRPRELAERFMAEDRQVLGSGAPLINQEECLALPNGEPRWLLATKIPLYDQQGHICNLIGISRDITERRRAEERVSRIAECFLNFGPNVLENINRLTALCGDLLGADCALYHHLTQGLLCSWGQWHVPPGYNPVDNREGQLCYDVIQNARDQVFIARNLPATSYAQTDPSVLLCNMQTYVGRAVKLGDECVGSLCVVYQRDVEPSTEDEHVMGVIATAIAVEERRQRVEEALQTQRDFAMQVLNTMGQGLTVTNAENRYEYVNPAFARMLGATPDDLIGKQHEDVIAPEDRTILQDERLKRDTGETSSYEVRHRHADGHLVPVMITGAPRGRPGQAVGAIAVVTDLTEVKQRERELQAVAAVSAAMRAAPTRGEMLPVILNQAQLLLNAEAASVITREPTTGDAVVELQQGTWTGKPGYRIPSSQGISGRVFETGRPYVTNDLPNDPYYFWPDRVGHLRSLAMVPLIAQSRVVGALNIARVTPIAPEDVRVLAAIADIAANALHRAALHEETEQHVQQLTALHTIDQTISASLDLRFTLNVLLDQVITQLGVDAAYILLLDPALQTLTYAAGRGFRSKTVERLSFHFGESYAGRVALEQRVINIRNLAQPTENEHSSRLSSEGFVSYCGVPLVTKGKVTGVLEVYQRTPQPASPARLDFLEMLADQAAIAIDNAQLFDELQRTNSNLLLSYDATIEGWARALELRDPVTEGHPQRVVQLTEQLARAVNISESELIHIRRGALLHDIGKLAIPDSILLKPGALTDAEWTVMRRHPELALELLKPIPYLRADLDIPYCHHENWDGTGYPRGLKGEAIPIAAQLFAVVDVWDALRSDRPFRAAWSDAQARDYLHEQAGKKFDPKLVERFFLILR